MQRNKYVNDLTILETHNSSLVQQWVQAFDMVKFSKETKDKDGLHDNIADVNQLEMILKI